MLYNIIGGDKMKLFKRENYLSKIRGFYHTNDIIKVITGIRRCGKSSLMQMIADEIIESGVNKENIIYINLDKKGFKSIKKADELENLIDSLSNVKGNKYLFIDEIQNVENFEEVINAYREEDEYSIFITGSNSYLLSGELITKLTGRKIEIIFDFTISTAYGVHNSVYIPIGKNGLILGAYSGYSGRRRLQVMDNGVIFESGGYYKTYGSSTTTEQNEMVIPIEIHGIKGVQ